MGDPSWSDYDQQTQKHKQDHKATAEALFTFRESINEDPKNTVTKMRVRWWANWCVQGSLKVMKDYVL